MNDLGLDEIKSGQSNEAACAGASLPSVINPLKGIGRTISHKPKPLIQYDDYPKVH
jgi:hypothetical protein